MNENQQMKSKDEKTIQEKEVQSQQVQTTIKPTLIQQKTIKPLSQIEQLERLTSQVFKNPYDVLQLDREAPEAEIRTQFKKISRDVHPDRILDPQLKPTSIEAFHVLDQAYKTLMDVDKRKIYQRVMLEAWDRTVSEREKENKKRQKASMTDLPADTFESQYKANCARLFDEIEERKAHFQKLEQSQNQRKQDDVEIKKMKYQIRVLTEDEWEKSRENRVSNWRKFSQKSTIVGTKKSSMQIRAPMVKLEERPASAPKLETSEMPVLGINEDYKKHWK